MFVKISHFNFSHYFHYSNDNVEYKKVSDNTTDLEDNPVFSQKHTKSQDQIESEELVMKIIEGVSTNSL